MYKHIDLEEIISLLIELKKEKLLNKIYFNKIIYLIEWKYMLMYNQELYSFSILKGNSGPEIKNFIYTEKIKNQKIITNIEIEQKKRIIDIILFIESKTLKFKYNKFVHLVFSTYPFFVVEKYNKLNKIKYARDYLKTLKGMNYQNAISLKTPLYKRILNLFK